LPPTCKEKFCSITSGSINAFGVKFGTSNEWQRDSRANNYRSLRLEMQIEAISAVRAQAAGARISVVARTIRWVVWRDVPSNHLINRPTRDFAAI